MKFILASICSVCFVLVFSLAPASASNGDTVGTLDVNDSESMSEVMTFDEMVMLIMDEQGITYNEAVELVSGGPVGVSQLAEIQQYATYRTFSQQITVTSVYKPSLKFYCETSESGHFVAVKRLINTDMDREYNGMSKRFDGTIFTHLQDSGTIFYRVNGDFYNNGSVSFNLGVSVGVGGKNTATFSVSGETSFYKYCYIEGTKKIPY